MENFISEELLAFAKRIARKSLGITTVLAAVLAALPVTVRAEVLSSFSDFTGRHVYQIGVFDAHVYQLYYNGGSWVYQDLTAYTGGKPAALFSPVASFADGLGEHVFYFDPNNHLNHLSSNNGPWVKQDLTAETGGPPVLTGSLAGFSDIDGPHVYYVAFNKHVNQIYWNYGSWANQDLTLMGRGPFVSPSGGITAFYDGSGEHVFYVDEIQHVNQLYYAWNEPWVNQDITLSAALSSGPPFLLPPLPEVSSDLASFADNSGEHVFYVNSSSEIYQLYFNGSWSAQDLSQQAGAPQAELSALAASSDRFGEHVFYVSPGSQHVEQLYLPYGGKWINQDITAAASAPGSDFCGVLAGGVLAEYSDSSGDNIYFVHDSGIYQLMWNGFSWSYEPVTREADGPPVSACSGFPL